ncbi:MAG: MFS transporter [Pseudomonadota bacterium]
MLTAIRNSWALLLGMFLLMIGNGLQGTVLGVRGEAEGFTAATLGFIMSAYFVGFLGGTQVTPWLLRRVGHVRVFAALASLVSAAFILFAAVVDPIAWTVLRLIIGFCFSGIYVVAESWLNDGASNETRGQTISAYVTAQMMGIVLAQALLNVSDPGGYDLFVIMSVLVSISFAPILLSSSPVPTFETARRMTLRKLIETSPLGCFGMFLLGTVFACLFGMGSVYAAAIDLSTAEISVFIGMIYVGGMVLQIPIGWASDRMDRRVLIAGVTAVGAAAAFIAPAVSGSFVMLTAMGFVIGGMANPLYSLLVAYVNDFLDHEDMASASGGLILINGVGAMGAPVLVGYVMDGIGPDGFFWFMGSSMAITAAYAFYRMTQRAATPVAETGPMVPMTPVASPVLSDVAWEDVAEQAQEEEAIAAEAEASTATP